jgi:hypothetical protein
MIILDLYNPFLVVLVEQKNEKRVLLENGIGKLNGGFNIT